jgi:N-terminal acetyltransferase B complex catalytic subunit
VRRVSFFTFLRLVAEHVFADGLDRYSVFRRVVNYYSDDPTGMSEKGEDAFDMRKPCSRDKKLEHIRENGENFPVSPEHVS